MQSEGNSAGSKAPQFRMDGCVEGLVCKTVYDNAGPEIRVRKDDGFTPSQELPSPPEKESEDMADRVARLMKATKSDEAPVPEYIWNEAILRGLSFTPQQEAAAWPKAHGCCVGGSVIYSKTSTGGQETGRTSGKVRKLLVRWSTRRESWTEMNWTEMK